MLSFVTSFAFVIQQLAAQTDKYIRVDQALAASNAQAYCDSEYGTDLASIHSIEDDEDARQLCRAGGFDCWIGLNFDSFEWTDGTAFDYGGVTGGHPWGNTSSQGGQPDNYNEADNEDCVQISDHLDTWDWDDSNCLETKHFLCNGVSSDIYNTLSATTTNGTTEVNVEENTNTGSTTNTILTIRTWILTVGLTAACLWCCCCCVCGACMATSK